MVKKGKIIPAGAKNMEKKRLNSYPFNSGKQKESNKISEKKKKKWPFS